MSKEKQSGDCKNRNSHIEEMAVTTCSLYRGYLDKKCAGNGECDFNCHHYDRCEKLYEKGYRKQTNGEWIETDDENGYESSRCSKCGCEQVRKSYYCPDCGAKMKGGE